MSLGVCVVKEYDAFFELLRHPLFRCLVMMMMMMHYTGCRNVEMGVCWCWSCVRVRLCVCVIVPLLCGGCGAPMFVLVEMDTCMGGGVPSFCLFSFL